MERVCNECSAHTKVAVSDESHSRYFPLWVKTLLGRPPPDDWVSGAGGAKQLLSRLPSSLSILRCLLTYRLFIFESKGLFLASREAIETMCVTAEWTLATTLLMWQCVHRQVRKPSDPSLINVLKSPFHLIFVLRTIRSCFLELWSEKVTRSCFDKKKVKSTKDNWKMWAWSVVKFPDPLVNNRELGNLARATLKSSTVNAI